MDAELYDEFGNYIGPELDSDEGEEEEEFQQQAEEEVRWDMRGGERHDFDKFTGTRGWCRRRTADGHCRGGNLASDCVA